MADELTRESARPRFVVARIVLLRAPEEPSPWVAAIDTGWSPDQGLGPWVGGTIGATPMDALRELGRAHEWEFVDYVRRVGYPVDG